MAATYRKMGVSEATFYNWKKECSGMGVTDVRELRQLREEASQCDERWSMDFVTDRLENDSHLRSLTVADQYTRECLALMAGQSLKGTDIARCLTDLLKARSSPCSITVDNGSEFFGQEMDS